MLANPVCECVCFITRRRHQELVRLPGSLQQSAGLLARPKRHGEALSVLDADLAQASFCTALLALSMCCKC